jgi:Uma2 family endonuclease
VEPAAIGSRHEPWATLTEPPGLSSPEPKPVQRAKEPYGRENLPRLLSALYRLDLNILADYPNPDLAIEIDISPSKIDRPAIYATLKVPEIWRFEDESVLIEQLGPDGTYNEVESSRFLRVRRDEVVRWLIEEDSRNEGEWALRLREWVQVELKRRASRGA